MTTNISPIHTVEDATSIAEDIYHRLNDGLADDARAVITAFDEHSMCEPGDGDTSYIALVRKLVEQCDAIQEALEEVFA